MVPGEVGTVEHTASLNFNFNLKVSFTRSSDKGGQST
jgi:hypothetical protein